MIADSRVADITIRHLTTLDECRGVAALERLVWGYTDAEDVVPPPVLIASIKRGAILLGAFGPEGGMKGFVFSMPGVKDGRLTQWSHMLGVVSEARGSGIGLRLKLAQREAALASGVELIEWTFDPLQALNAHFNFSSLGVVVQEYEENVYGESSSPLHRGTPTDRFLAEWRLTAPHVARRIAAGRGLQAAPGIRDRGILMAPVINPSRTSGEWLAPGEIDLAADARQILVEIPTSFGEMQLREPALALEWRLSTRRIFQRCFARGYRAVDFFLSPEAGRGQYLLAREA